MSKLFKAFLFASFLAFPFAASADVTVASWGGAYTESQIKAYVDTYDAATVRFENYNGGLGEIKAQVDSGNIAWDIADVLPSNAITGCDEGLFEDLGAQGQYDNFIPAADGTSMEDDVAANSIATGDMPSCCVPQIFWSYVVFYDPDAFSGPKPSTVTDFFDVEKFPGKRGIHTWANANVEMALLSDGVKPGGIYKVLENQTGALDRAFGVLDKIKDHVVFWSSGAKPLELVKSGEVVMSIAYNGRIGAANLSEGENFEYIWDSQVIEEEYLCMLKGTPNYDEALAWMIHATSPTSQAEQAKYIPYSPMRASADPIIAAGEPWFHNGQTVLNHMPNTPERMKISVIANPEFWDENGTEIGERFSAWMGK